MMFLSSFCQGLTGPIGPPGPSGPNGAKVNVPSLPWSSTIDFMVKLFEEIV